MTKSDQASRAKTSRASDEANRDGARGYTDADMAEVMDSPEATDEQLAAARPLAEMFPALAESIKRTRGPQKSPRKQQVTLRLDAEVLAHFKRGGEGWQVRIGAALRKAAGL